MVEQRRLLLALVDKHAAFSYRHSYRHTDQKIYGLGACILLDL